VKRKTFKWERGGEEAFAVAQKRGMKDIVKVNAGWKKNQRKNSAREGMTD